MARGRWTRVVGIVALVGAAGSLAWVLVDRWQQAGAVHLRWGWGWVAGAAACGVAADLVMSGAWTVLMERSGDRSGWRTRTRVFWVGQLARFLPTGLGSLPARVVVGGRAGMSRRRVAGTTVAELVASGATAGVAGLLVLPGLVGVGAAVTGLVGSAAGFAGLAARRLGSRSEVDLSGLGGAVGGAFVLAHQSKVLLRATGLWCLLHMVTVVGPGFRSVVGAVGLGYLAGLVAIVPGGLGVREATIIAVLAASGAGAAGAAGAAAGWRLVETAVEPPLVGAAVLGGRTSRSSLAIRPRRISRGGHSDELGTERAGQEHGEAPAQGGIEPHGRSLRHQRPPENGQGSEADSVDADDPQPGPL